jgi:Zn-dependent protease/CBS domain-containing protein
MEQPRSPGGLRIARIYGVPVYLHFSWLIIFGLITWTLAAGYFPSRYPDLPASSHWAKALVASLAFFLSILLHELGHAVVALRHGVAIRSITLFIFGGVSLMEKDAPDGDTEFKIAVVGPVVSLALAGTFWLASSATVLGPSARAVALYLAQINLVLALFNLVPAFPLDGGRILRGFLWRSTGKLQATRTAAGAGTFFAYFLIASGVFGLLGGSGVVGVWQILIGWFLKEAASGTWRSTSLQETLHGLTVRDAMLASVATIPAHISLAEAARDYFARTGFGAYPVERGGEPVGLLSLHDLLRHPQEEREASTVQAAMRPLGGEIVIGPEEPLLAAISRMSERGASRLLVMEGRRMVGYLTLRTIMRYVNVRQQLTA